MFEHLLAAEPSPDKWEGAWKGRNPNQLLSVEDGVKLQELILGGISKYHKFPTGVRKVSLVAQVFVHGLDTFVEVSKMEGLDRKRPIMLHVEVEQGGDRDTSNDIVESPSETQGAIMLGARPAAEAIARNGVERGLEGLFIEINRAFSHPSQSVKE